jgi:hypothetical protein
VRGLYRRRHGPKGARNYGELRGRIALSPGKIFGQRLKPTRSADMWGRVASGRGKGCVPFREGARVGRGPLLLLGRRGSPGPFLFFLFFSFHFLFSDFLHTFCILAPN